VPVTANNRLIAVLDIDGKDEGQFDATDQEYLESIVKFLL
jgi:putative methionine-R-sulfoxide reductase with GAF domain